MKTVIALLLCCIMYAQTQALSTIQNLVSDTVLVANHWPDSVKYPYLATVTVAKAVLTERIPMFPDKRQQLLVRPDAITNSWATASVKGDDFRVQLLSWFFSNGSGDSISKPSKQYMPGTIIMVDTVSYSVTFRAKKLAIPRTGTTKYDTVIFGGALAVTNQGCTGYDGYAHWATGDTAYMANVWARYPLPSVGSETMRPLPQSLAKAVDVDNRYFDISGRCIGNKKPVRAGVYVCGGRKVLVLR